MRKLLLLFALVFGTVALGQSNEHSMVRELVTTSDVVVVAKHRPPQVWIASESVILTGQSEALVLRTLKGDESRMQRIKFEVVRHLDFDGLSAEAPSLPGEATGFPETPATPTEFQKPADSVNLEHFDKVMLFLRRAQNGSLRAADGFLYSLPYSPELEALVSILVKNQSSKVSQSTPDPQGVQTLAPASPNRDQIIIPGQGRKHPRILAGSAISMEQASSLGLLVTDSPRLSRGDKLLLEFGTKRLLVEVVEYTYLFGDDKIDESVSLNWMIIQPDSVATDSKRLVHKIKTTRLGNHSFHPSPKSETVDELNFSWHVDSPADSVILNLPPGTFYTLIRQETATDASLPR